MELDINEELAFAAETADDLDFTAEEFVERVGTGFNEYGVRKNEDDDGELHSVDVIFAAMEPGPPERRKGVRITAEFLKKVAAKDYDSKEPPHLLDHRSRETFAKIGNVKDVWYSDLHGKLFIQARVPNTGAPTHTEAIARYTFEPPSIEDGSVGFGNDFTAVRNDDGEPELADATLREFSTVNFPGGYDEGGVAPAFAEEAVAAAETVSASDTASDAEADDADFDDPSNDEEPSDGDEGENSAADFSVQTETITY